MLTIRFRDLVKHCTAVWDAWQALATHKGFDLPKEHETAFHEYTAGRGKDAENTTSIKREAFAAAALDYLARHGLIELRCTWVFRYGTLPGGEAAQADFATASKKKSKERHVIIGALFRDTDGAALVDLHEPMRENNTGDLQVCRTVGELYDVDDAVVDELLAKLDGHAGITGADSRWVRRLCSIESIWGDRAVAWAYVINQPDQTGELEVIPNGVWPTKT